MNSRFKNTDPDLNSLERSSFVRNAMRALVLRCGLLVVNLATALVLARILGPEQYGIYIFAFAIMTIIALPGRAGIPMITVREISFRIVDRDWSGVLGIVTRTRQLIFGYCLIVGVVMVLSYFFLLSGWLSQQESLAILWSAALLPAFIMVAVIGASLRGLNRLGMGQFVETLFRPTTFLILVLVLVFLFDQSMDAASAMMLHAVGALAIMAVAMVLQRRVLAPQTAGLAPNLAMRDILSGLAPLTFVAGMQLIIGKTDILMLRAMRTPEEVSFYYVALQWANLALLAQQAAQMVTDPPIARAWRQGDLAAVQRLMTSAARLIFFLALPLGGALLIFGEEIIALSFGPEYAPAMGALSVLVIGRMIESTYGVIIQLAKIVRWEGLMFKLVVVSALANVLLNYLLIPSYGIAGAALAGVIATLFWKSVLLVLAWRRLGLSSFVFGRRPENPPASAAVEKSSRHGHKGRFK
jgi:O-antigen/teichoic acid export membrane protein